MREVFSKEVAKPIRVQVWQQKTGFLDHTIMMALIADAITGKVLHVGKFNYIRRVAREKYNIAISD